MGRLTEQATLNVLYTDAPLRWGDRLPMAHRVYEAIVSAVRTGILIEPFSRDDFRSACSGFGEGTYNAFLDKHAVGDPGNNSELFERVSPGKFECVRLLKYGV